MGRSISEACNDPEFRQRRSEIAKGLWDDDRRREFAQVVKERWQDDGFREKISVSMKRSWADPDIRASRIEGIIASWSDERRQHQSDLTRGMWSDVERRRKICLAIRRSYTPERRAKASETHRRRIYRPDVYAWYRLNVWDRFKGENSPMWNPNLTHEDRIRSRNYPEYATWRTAVFKRDGYVCQLTGQRGGRLEAHHIESYDVNPDLRLDANNGVTLSREVHREFHRRYGKGRNTRAQYEEFIASFHLERQEVTHDQTNVS